MADNCIMVMNSVSIVMNHLKFLLIIMITVSLRG